MVFLMTMLTFKATMIVLFVSLTIILPPKTHYDLVHSISLKDYLGEVKRKAETNSTTICRNTL